MFMDQAQMNHNQYITEQPGKLEAQFLEIRKTMFGENFWTTLFPVVLKVY